MVINSVNSQNEQEYKNAGFWRTTGAIAAGSAASVAVTKLSKKFIIPKLVQKMYEQEQFSLERDKFDVSKNIDDALQQTGLAKKGVSIQRVANTQESKAAARTILQEELKQNKILSFLPKPIKTLVVKVLAEEQAYMLAEGKNAFCLSNKNVIILPQKGMELTTFHELGHAANKNLSIIGKGLQKCRGLALLALPIGLIGLFKSPKAPGQKSDSVIGKTTDFIKNNAGKLAFLSFMPLLAEEAMASIKGLKFAKASGLAPELLKKMNKANAFGLSSYVLLALLSSISTVVAIKVRDAIAHPKPVEQK